MKMNAIAFRFSCIALTGVMVLCAGCATIFNWNASAKVPVDADVDGVCVTVKKSGEQVGQFRAPCEVELKSSRGFFSRANYEFVFEKKGYQTEYRYRNGELSGWYVGNILLGGLIGFLIVDPLTGSMYSIDGMPINVHMNKMSNESDGKEDNLIESDFTIISLAYDASRHTGVIKLKYPPAKYEQARKYLRRNIETLAKDKNVALTTGEDPVPARYYIREETILESGVMEVAFEVE